MQGTQSRYLPRRVEACLLVVYGRCCILQQEVASLLHACCTSCWSVGQCYRSGGPGIEPQSSCLCLPAASNHNSWLADTIHAFTQVTMPVSVLGSVWQTVRQARILCLRGCSRNWLPLRISGFMAFGDRSSWATVNATSLTAIEEQMRDDIDNVAAGKA